MHEVLDSASDVLAILLGAVRENALWMGWNSMLALVPLGLAVALVRLRRHGVAWWLGAVAFVLFLPNAPYVFTDVIHLFDDVRSTTTDREIVFGLLPVYGAFFAVGLGSYVACISLARRTLVELGARGLLAWELALHLLSAVGVYVGRVHRLDSWDLAVRPRSVHDALGSVSGDKAAIAIALMCAAIAVLAVATRVAVAGAIGAVRAWRAA